MQLIQDEKSNHYIVKQYLPGEIYINSEKYTQSIILRPNKIRVWGPKDFKSIFINDLSLLLDVNPEVVILGTGTVQHFLSHALKAVFMEKQIGLEMMDTAAACRTYNLLASDGRNVVAGLLMR